MVVRWGDGGGLKRTEDLIDMAERHVMDSGLWLKMFGCKWVSVYVYKYTHIFNICTFSLRPRFLFLRYLVPLCPFPHSAVSMFTCLCNMAVSLCVEKKNKIVKGAGRRCKLIFLLSC